MLLKILKKLKMKKFGNLISNFLFENFVILFLVSNFFVLLSFFISFFFNLKNNKKYFYLQIAKIFKSFFILIIVFYLFNILNDVKIVNHIKFTLDLFLIIVTLSISLFFFKNQDIYKNSLSYLNLFNILIILDIFLFRIVNVSFLTIWNNLIPIDSERYSGIFFDENILGFYLLCCMPLILLFRNNYSLIYKNEGIFLFVIICYVLAIYFTGERRSFILSLLSLLFISYNLKLFSKLKKKLLLLFILFSVGLTAIFFFKNSFLNKDSNFYDLNFRMFSQTFDTIKTLPILIENEEAYKTYIADNDIGNWFLLYSSSFKIFTKDTKTTLIGIGFKNYKSKCVEYKKLTCSTHPHHYLIEIIISFGLIGFSILLFYLYKVLKYLYIQRKYFKEYIIFLLTFFSHYCHLAVYFLSI